MYKKEQWVIAALVTVTEELFCAFWGAYSITLKRVPTGGVNFCGSPLVPAQGPERDQNKSTSHLLHAGVLYSFQRLQISRAVVYMWLSVVKSVVFLGHKDHQ